MSVETQEAPVAEIPAGPTTEGPQVPEAPQPAQPASPEPQGLQFGDPGPEADLPPPRERQRGPDGRFTPRSQEPNQPAAPVQPAQPQAPPDWLTGDVLKHAEFYGFTPEEARTFGDSNRLYAALAAMDRRLMAQYSASPQAPQLEQAGAMNPPAPAVQPPPAPVNPAVAKFDLSKFSDKFDEDTNAVLNALNEHYHAQLASVANPLGQLGKHAEQLEQLNQAYRQMDEFVARQEGLRFEAEMDSYFESLGDDYADVFGKGPIRSLNPQMQAARKEFAQRLHALNGIDEQMGRGVAPVRESADRVRRAYYGETKESQIRKQVRQEVAQRQSQAIARPTATTTREQLDPVQAAARRANEFYKARGFAVNEGGENAYRDGI